METHFDLIIIGAGPAGFEVAARESANKKVLIIERQHLGGTCLNRGCIPTKCLCAAADTLRTVRAAAEFGIATDEVTADYGVAVERMRAVVNGLREGVRASLSRCTVIEGDAAITASGAVRINGTEYTADRVLIATGSRPSSLPIPGAELAITSDEFLCLNTLPKTVVIIGGGVIGIEFASILNAYGVEVRVVEYCKEILPPFDGEIAKRLRTALTRRGIQFNLGAAAKSIVRTDGGLAVNFETKKGEESAEAEMVLMAVGRRAVLPDGLAVAGIEVDKRGYIVVDNSFKTTRDRFYAVGDCNGRMMLAHAATAQAMRAVGVNINLDAIPSAVFTAPEAAMVGLTTERCKALGLNFATSKGLFAANGKARAMGTADGLVKVVYDPDTRRLLGCHIVGPHAADLIQEAAIAIANGLSVDDIAHTIHAHPTLAEVVAAAVAAIRP